MSDVTQTADWREMRGKLPAAPSFTIDLLPLLALRAIGHLPYFKIASGLLLPVPLGLAGAALTALIYATLCLSVSLWLGRRRTETGHRPGVAGLLAGVALLLGVMLLAGPAIAVLLSPAETTATPSGATLLGPYFALLLPVVAGFFAVQFTLRQCPPAQR